MEEQPSNLAQNTQSQRFTSTMRSSSMGNKRAMYATSNQEYGSGTVYPTQHGSIKMSDRKHSTLRTRWCRPMLR